MEEARLPVAIASLTPMNQALQLIDLLGIDKLVPRENMVFLEDVGEQNKKPKPHGYLEAAKRLGIPPRNLVAFEDSGPGIKSAHDAGLQTLAVPIFWFRIVLKEIVDAGAARIFRHYREINFPALFQELQEE